MMLRWDAGKRRRHPDGDEIASRDEHALRVQSTIAVPDLLVRGASRLAHRIECGRLTRGREVAIHSCSQGRVRGVVHTSAPREPPPGASRVRSLVCQIAPCGPDWPSRVQKPRRMAAGTRASNLTLSPSTRSGNARLIQQSVQPARGPTKLTGYDRFVTTACRAR